MHAAGAILPTLAPAIEEAEREIHRGEALIETARMSALAEEARQAAFRLLRARAKLQPGYNVDWPEGVTITNAGFGLFRLGISRSFEPGNLAA